MNPKFTFISLYLLLFATFQFLPCVAKKQTIYVAGFYPDSSSISAPNFKIMGQFAENQINNNNLDLLNDYNIEVVWKNTKCIERYALEGFIDFLRDDTKRYLLLVGPVCSDLAAGVAQVSYLYGLTQLTYGSRSPSLGNIKRYPGFIRGNPSDINIVAGWIKYIQTYNWRRLAILNQQGDYFISTSQELQLILQELDIEHYVGIFDPESIRFDEQVETILSDVDTQGYRIIIINAYQDTMVKFLCHLKKFPALHPPSTTMFIYGWYGINWYRDPYAATDGECDLSDIQELTKGAIAFNSLPSIEELLSANNTLYNGKTPNQVYQESKDYITNVKSEDFFYRKFRVEDLYLYDSMWTLALALNKTAAEGYNLTDVGNYTLNNEFNKALYKNIISLDYIGWTGRVSFVENERYDGRIHILEVVNGSLEFRGHLRNIPPNPADFSNSSRIQFDLEYPFKYWSPELASDGIESHPIHVAIFPLLFLLSLLASVYVTAVVITILVCWCKRIRAVTTSEPAVTITILSGTYFLFLLAVLLPLDGRYVAGSSYAGGVVFCQARTWLLAVSISIIFGGMLGKAGKYYIIVIKKRFDFSHRLKPIYIVLFPLLLVALDTLYFAVWLFVAPKVLLTHEIESGLLNPPRYIVTQCVASSQAGDQVFLWLLIALKSVLVVIGLFLAYNLRKVTHKSLKYTATVTWTMYNTSICSLGIVLILLLVDNLELRYSLSGVLSVVEGVVAAAIVSGPILYYLIRDPKSHTFFNPGNKDFPETKELLEMRIQALIKDNEILKRESNRKSKSEIENTLSESNTVSTPYVINEGPMLNAID